MANFKRKSVQYAQRHLTAKKYGGEYPEIICTLIEKGMSMEYVRKMFGVSNRTVYDIIAKYGNPENIKPKKRYSEELICDVFKSKLKYRDISDQYNIPMATVGSIKGLSDAYIIVYGSC